MEGLPPLAMFMEAGRSLFYVAPGVIMEGDGGASREAEDAQRQVIVRVDIQIGYGFGYRR